MLNKIYPTQSYRSNGSAFTTYPGGPSGFASNDILDQQLRVDSLNTGYFNRATDNTAQPSFVTGLRLLTNGQLIFNSASEGYALQQAVIQCSGQNSYVYFNTTDTTLSGFKMIPNSVYDFNGPITQIVAYSAVSGTQLDVMGIPVSRP